MNQDRGGPARGGPWGRRNQRPPTSSMGAAGNLGGNGFGRDGRQHEPPAFNAPRIVLMAIGFLIAVCVVSLFLPARARFWMDVIGGVSTARFLAGPEANGGWALMLAPLATHMALHAGFMHLFFNSVWLLAFGAPVARRLGCDVAGRRSDLLFVAFFVISGMAGALFHIVLNAGSNDLLVGASGGVSGLLGGLVRFGLRAPRTVMGGGGGGGALAPLTDRRVLIWSGFIIAMNMFLAFYGGGVAGGRSVSWEAHVGGYLFGLLTFPVFDRMAPRFR